MTRELEYLEEALDEAEAAALWYAERSVTAAAAFSSEVDAAEAIGVVTDRWAFGLGEEGVSLLPIASAAYDAWAQTAPTPGSS